MRRAGFFCLLLALAAICAAQDTNFPVGPQYLITSDSPLFLRPIATPSLSLGAPLTEIANPISTAPAASSEPVTSNPALQNQPNLFPIYYGVPETSQPSSVIEISSAEPPRPLPAGILDVGVTGMTDTQSLRERGYGVSLGEAAAYWKTHKPHAPRVYTNRDVARLHGG